MGVHVGQMLHQPASIHCVYPYVCVKTDFILCTNILFCCAYLTKDVCVKFKFSLNAIRYSMQHTLARTELLYFKLDKFVAFVYVWKHVLLITKWYASRVCACM